MCLQLNRTSDVKFYNMGLYCGRSEVALGYKEFRFSLTDKILLPRFNYSNGKITPYSSITLIGDGILIKCDRQQQTIDITTYVSNEAYYDTTLLVNNLGMHMTFKRIEEFICNYTDNYISMSYGITQFVYVPVITIVQDIDLIGDEDLITGKVIIPNPELMNKFRDELKINKVAFDKFIEAYKRDYNNLILELNLY